MAAKEFEGTLVLETLAAAGLVDEFMNAVDEDDFKAAARLMRRAGVVEKTIARVLEMMADPEGEH